MGNSSSPLPEVFVVILNWNQPKDTIECLQSLSQQRGVKLRTIVVDNGSTDDSLEKINQAFPYIDLLPLGKNMGFPGGMNAGIRRAMETGTAPILLLNNDTVADPDMVLHLISRQTKGVGVTAPLIFYASEPSKVWDAGGFIQPILLEMLPFKRQLKTDKDTFRTFFTGCAILVKQEVFEDVGLFDERFFPIYYEDLDLSLRFCRSGWKMLLVPEAKLWHKVSQASGGSRSPRVRFLMARNSAWYFRKHMQTWQAPIIFSYRLLSGIKTTIILTIQRDFKGIKAYWTGFIIGWFNRQGVNASKYLSQY